MMSMHDRIFYFLNYLKNKNKNKILHFHKFLIINKF
jgi:hypothetical protein